MALEVPAKLAASCSKTPERATWLRRLPQVLARIEREWRLEVGRPFEAEVSCAWVAPVTLADGTEGVLKLPMPHFEGEHEMEGLLFWNGDPTVRVLRSDAEYGAMLLERCLPGTTLRTLPEPDQDTVIAGLLRRLWRVPSNPHPFRPLSALMNYWREQTLAKVRRWPDAGIVREGLQLMADLPRNAPCEVLLTTDLHAGNVLRAGREPWLAIDPKPFVGDPAFDATQHLFNCDRLHTEPKELVRRMAGLLELEFDRVRLWTFARAAAEPREKWSEESLRVARSLAP